MTDTSSSKTQAATQWLRDLAHRITLYDVDERRLREIATEFERVQRELAEAEAELERRPAPEGPNVAGASSTKIACSCGQPHCHECGEDTAIVGYERTAEGRNDE